MVSHSEPLPYFGDSIDPDLIPYSHAALYSGDCDHPAPAEAVGKFKPENRRWISFKGDPGCFIVDFEKGTSDFAHPVEVSTWFNTRRRHFRRCCIYTDMSNAVAAFKAVNFSRHCLFWVATLDGREQTPSELSNRLHSEFHANIPADQIWAQQIETVNNAYDKSRLFLPWV